MVFTRAALSALALALSTVSAHVTLSPKYAEPGQNLSTSFHVPHGCNGSSTTSIFVTIPKEITALTAQSVPNWNLTTTYRDSSNASVETITWFGGKLSPEDALDFPLSLTVPNVDLSAQSNVTLYFPIIQTCEVGTANWTSIPPAVSGEPAPTLLIVKNATQAAADAIAMKGTATASAHGASSTSSSSTTSAANNLYAGMLPIAAAAVAAIGFSL
ncbi:hypothetical protein INT47_005423 [Mucor saturninus]|uniref:YncI copper-binding domain-containing protein n=1 Tax=Mucor saturninus TaxID=64648 RepID=A0A8H7QTZ4_9FUNG|nr:hypothetical protein INT47_005423 [Mucor saturninus]